MSSLHALRGEQPAEVAARDVDGLGDEQLEAVVVDASMLNVRGRARESR